MTTYGTTGYGKILPWGGITFPAPTTPVSLAGDIQTKGIIEATLEAISESDNEIGGFVMTRLSSAQSEGDTTLTVESTLDWPDSGKLGLGGLVYYYTGKTATTFTGISHIAAGVSTPGLAIDHRVDSSVIDVNLQRSALELVRRALFVDTAEDEYLKVVGRNLGVNYIPIFGDDDQFREIIKFMAYCPKGATQGLEAALTGLVGAGNFEIYEDLIMYPNTVFIKIDSSVITGSVSAGKAYLTGHAWDDLSGSQDTLTLGATPITVQGVTLKDLGEVFDFRNDKPSALTYAYWEGETPASAFTYTGSESEATSVTQVAGLYTKFKSNSGGTVYYRMLDTQGARITPDSYVEYNVSMQIPTGSILSAGDLLQAHLSIEDGDYRVNAGLENDMSFGLFATEGGGHLGSTVTLVVDQFYDITIKKFDDDYVELWVDGQLIETQAYSAFTDTTTNHRVEFGIAGTPATNMEVWFKQLGLDIINIVDYWSAREDGTGTVATANPTRLVLSGATHVFVSGDVGDGFRISGSGVTNPSGGNNNGDWVIDSFVSGTTVELLGRQHTDAEVSITNPLRVEVPSDRKFKYPDDLGKELVISGSALGNNGTYVIDKLLQEGTFTDFSTFATPIEEYTTICEVSAATFTTETGLDWKLKPVFITETGLDWVQADASSFVTTTLTLRQALWVNGLVMEISLSDVLTGQLLKDIDVGNLVIDLGPPVLYEYYPMYLADPVGAIAAYIDTITAAGVIPEVLMV